MSGEGNADDGQGDLNGSQYHQDIGFTPETPEYEGHDPSGEEEQRMFHGDDNVTNNPAGDMTARE